MADTETISPADLRIDDLNPRIEQPNVGQRKALQEIARLMGRKLQVLAKDILDHGLDPSSLPIVMEHGEEHGRYIVLEGNRRLAAIRALESPDAIADAVKPAVLGGIRKLSKRYQGNPIEEITCVVVKDRELARHWMELRHTGGYAGAGVLDWSPDQVARFRARGGLGDIRNQALDFLVRRSEMIPEDRKGNWGSSTFARLLRTPVFRERLGLEWSKGVLSVLSDEAATAKALRKVVRDLASKDVKVTDVYTKEGVEKYAKTLPDLAARRKSGEGIPAALGGAPVKRKSTPTAHVPRRRDHLIPKECILNIPAGRVQDIERELRKLSLDTHTNAVGVLFRVFIELSADSYIDKQSLGIDVMKSLDVKMRAALEDLLAKRKLTNDQAKPVRMACQRNSFLAPSITIMNTYVHNVHVFPAPGDLRAHWDSLETFITALWAA
jgi:hypothetical protein